MRMKVLNLQAFCLCTHEQESDLMHVLGEELVCGSDFSSISQDFFLERGEYMYKTNQYVSK